MTNNRPTEWTIYPLKLCMQVVNKVLSTAYNYVCVTTVWATDRERDRWWWRQADPRGWRPQPGQRRSWSSRWLPTTQHTIEAPILYHINTMFEITSDASTNAGKHVTLMLHVHKASNTHMIHNSNWPKWCWVLWHKFLPFAEPSIFSNALIDGLLIHQFFLFCLPWSRILRGRGRWSVRCWWPRRRCRWPWSPWRAG